MPNNGSGLSQIVRWQIPKRTFWLKRVGLSSLIASWAQYGGKHSEVGESIEKILVHLCRVDDPPMAAPRGATGFCCRFIHPGILT